MAVMGDLPNEIILQILSSIPPPDIESVSIICKQWHDLAKDVLVEHRQLKKKYGSLDDKDPLTIPQLLGLDNTDILWYIRRLTFHCDRVNYHSWHRFPQRSLPVLKHGNYFRGDRLARVQAVHDSVYPPGERYESWMEMIKNGHDGPLKALLIQSCPNLATLVFTHRYLEGMRKMSFYIPPYSFDLMMDILLVYQRSQIKELLPSLRRIFVNCDGDGGFGHVLYENVNMSPHHIKGLMALPSLTEIQVANCMRLPDWEEPRPQSQEIEPRSSSVEKLDLGTMFIETRVMDDLLGSIKTLKSYSTQDPGNNTGIMLSRYHKNTLEALQFGNKNGGVPPQRFNLAILHQFPALKSLSLDVTHLYKWSNDEPRDLIKPSLILPRSLEMLQLFGSPRKTTEAQLDACQRFIDHLTTFAETKAETNPSLWGICLSRLDLLWAVSSIFGNTDSDRPLCDLSKLEKSCRDNEIVLTVGKIASTGPCPYPPRMKDVDYVCKVCRSRLKFGTDDRKDLAQCFG